MGITNETSIVGWEWGQQFILADQAPKIDKSYVNYKLQTVQEGAARR